jgi:hypothetical protein
MVVTIWFLLPGAPGAAGRFDFFLAVRGSLLGYLAQDFFQQGQTAFQVKAVPAQVS